MNQLFTKICIFLLITSGAQLTGQSNSDKKLNARAVSSVYSSTENFIPLNLDALRKQVKNNVRTTSSERYNLGHQFKSVSNDQNSLILDIKRDAGKIVWLEVNPSKELKKKSNIELGVKRLLEEHGHYFNINDLDQNSRVNSIQMDELGESHIRVQQLFKGIPVHQGEIIIHTQEGTPYLINGKTIKIEPSLKIRPSIHKEEIIEILKSKENIKSIQPKLLQYIGHRQFESELLVYKHLEKAKLVYMITVYPDITEQWTYQMDAHTGEILSKYRSSCKFHDHNHSHELIKNNGLPLESGPESATGTDLSGSAVGLNVYEESGVYFLLNIGENMYNPTLSQLPNEPVGGILTLDANNTAPQNSNFSVNHITSSNNSWSDQIGVTAHANATTSYKYFEEVLGLRSYDNNGSTIYSFTNVADMDGSAMDNAFWNGYAMYYGNGKEAFARPLAAALDVAAHELTHGVIQNTANLEYQNESGALNESFADIFAVLIERETYSIGEDIVNTSVFRSGALRSLSDPHNGGTRLGDPGWQPKHVNEQFRGSEDNGGVHINSGIPNYAFFLFANNEDVGVVNAEAIYFKALRDYLTSSSDFKALRRAVGRSIIDLFGQDETILAAYNSAFDQVGIEATDITEPIPDPVQEFDTNPGEDFVVWYQPDDLTINVQRQSDQMNFVLSTQGLANRPSISDDGRIILFIGQDGNMYAILIDWENGGTFEELLIDENTEWRNVAISKDGNRIAALSGNLAEDRFDNQMLIIDLASSTQKWFELYNPTFAQDVQTEDVLYADAIEWDHTSQSVMYDAFNEIPSFFNESITYWDIGFIDVWDNATDDYSDGNIRKLFATLPDDVSVGNPTFSKISPDRIALDVIDSRGEELDLFLLGVNLENGDQGVIFENLNTLGYPNYSSKDDRVLFNILQNNQPAIAFQTLAEDAITGSGDAFLFINDGQWGTWLSNGTRDLTTASYELIASKSFTIFPNPSQDNIRIQSDLIACNPCQLEIYNSLGQKNLSLEYDKRGDLDVSGLQSGNYIVKITEGTKVFVNQFVKAK